MTAACMVRFAGKAKDLKKFLADIIEKLQKEEEGNDE